MTNLNVDSLSQEQLNSFLINLNLVVWTNESVTSTNITYLALTSKEQFSIEATLVDGELKWHHSENKSIKFDSGKEAELALASILSSKGYYPIFHLF